jgi:hypothetical protein
MQCNAMKEGKAFPVLFGDLTSHYPISSPALGNKRVSSSSSRREILYALHCTLHTAACHFLFFPSTSPCYTCTFDSSNSSRAPYPPMLSPADCPVGLPGHVRGHRGFFSIPRRPYQSRAWDSGKATALAACRGCRRCVIAGDMINRKPILLAHMDQHGLFHLLLCVNRDDKIMAIYTYIGAPYPCIDEKEFSSTYIQKKDRRKAYNTKTLSS